MERRTLLYRHDLVECGRLTSKVHRQRPLPTKTRERFPGGQCWVALLDDRADRTVSGAACSAGVWVTTWS